MKKNIRSIMFLVIMVLSLVLTVGCVDSSDNWDNKSPTIPAVIEDVKEVEDISPNEVDESSSKELEESPPVVDLPLVIEEEIEVSEDIFSGYKVIEVDGGNTSGYREPNVVVDIGFGDREYWAFTNEYGQLVRVVAKEIILQDDNREPVTSDGRYYSKMADVPGVGAATGYDRGHIIADSLGGVANAYNITPQNATLNRHGDQAYMEKAIRDAGGCTDFEAIITYGNTQTQIPSRYKYTYIIKGNKVVDEFDNVNPDTVNEDLGLTNANSDISDIDINKNGIITIKEAKDAGYKMPITKDHWLYPYMIDGDGDGSVGE